MILAQNAGPGTYGPFNFKPGNYLFLAASAAGSANATVKFTDELGNTYNVWLFSGTGQGLGISVPVGDVTLEIPAGYSGVNVTANPVS